MLLSRTLKFLVGQGNSNLTLSVTMPHSLVTGLLCSVPLNYICISFPSKISPQLHAFKFLCQPMVLICHHDLETARINGMLGNIDANTGDPQVGWDTDEFLTDVGEATMVMLSVIRNFKLQKSVRLSTVLLSSHLCVAGRTSTRRLQLRCKIVRRESTDVEDLFIAHISGMDTLARGLRNAAKLIEDGSLAELVSKRYSSFDTELGAQIEVAGKADFEMLEKKAMEWGEPKVASAKQELAEMIFQSALQFQAMVGDRY
ncbi:xylose isomerase-like [Gossypium australe]|uniref:Xylose isomerase n=1 Tax=Gossypium australe TaxID=47621 RepID=A0A5B6U9J7_9ROSI|nr:xylose isomerase-like [Gossypium australe]